MYNHYKKGIKMRVSPPTTRASITRKLEVQNFQLYLTIGFYDNCQPCEIFVKIAKQGSTLSGLLDSFAISISLGLQQGVPWSTYSTRLSQTRFEPFDDNYSSVIDAIMTAGTQLISQQGGQVDKDHEQGQTNAA